MQVYAADAQVAPLGCLASEINCLTDCSSFKSIINYVKCLQV